MLYSIYYLFGMKALDEQWPSLQYNQVVLCVNANDKNALIECYQKVQNGHPNLSFCLCLSETSKVDSECMNLIISYFFFTGYSQPSGVPVVVLENKSQKGFETFRDALQKSAGKQGFKKIKIIEKKAVGNIVDEYTAAETDKIKYDYKQALKSPVEKSFFIAVSNSSEVTAIEAMLQEVEVAFAAENRTVYNMQMENKTLRENVELLQHRLAVAEQEINHMASHLTVLRSKSQAGSLQQYYNNEYEVLPRWYKQFGHVLKVLRGNRTFRSLFDKAAKKI